MVAKSCVHMCAGWWARGQSQKRPDMPPQSVHTQVAGTLEKLFKSGWPGVGFQLTYQLGGHKQGTSASPPPPSQSCCVDWRWQTKSTLYSTRCVANPQECFLPFLVTWLICTFNLLEGKKNSSELKTPHVYHFTIPEVSWCFKAPMRETGSQITS